MNAPLVAHSRTSVNYSTAFDGDPKSPLSKAFDGSYSIFGQVEKAGLCDLSLNDIFARLEHLDRLHFSSSKFLRLVARPEPFLQFIDRHAKALDSMVQVYLNTLSLIWGTLRGLLEVIYGDREVIRRWRPSMHSLLFHVLSTSRSCLP